NKALRLQDMNMIYELSFFIADLYNQLSTLHSKQLPQLNSQTSFKVYRGTGLTQKDFDKIKLNVGSLISMNSFLSTSRDITVAVFYINHGVSRILKPTLFEITIEPSSVFVPFAEIKFLSTIKDEEEVLFSLNAIFKIQSISQDVDGIWIIR